MVQAAPPAQTANQLPAAKPANQAGPARRQPGILVALVVLGIGLLVFAPLSLLALRQTAQEERGSPTVTIQVAAAGMRFSPAEIRVPRGTTVQLEFTNNDSSSPHDFQTFRQAADTRVVAWPGESHTVYFRAARTPGRYSFICSVRGHSDAGMTGTIVVE